MGSPRRRPHSCTQARIHASNDRRRIVSGDIAGRRCGFASRGLDVLLQTVNAQFELLTLACAFITHVLDDLVFVAQRLKVLFLDRRIFLEVCCGSGTRPRWGAPSVQGIFFRRFAVQNCNAMGSAEYTNL